MRAHANPGVLVGAILAAVATAALGSPGSAPGREGPATQRLDRAVLDDPTRPAEERRQDEARKGLELYEWLGIEPGMTVADMWPGDGYNTHLLSRLMGSSGEVVAVWHWYGDLTFGPDYNRRPAFERRAAAAGLDNVIHAASFADVADDSVDVALSVRNYHDLWMNDGWDPIEFVRHMYRFLEPGGIVGIVDLATSHEGFHRPTHRLNEQVVLDHFAAVGFELVGRSDMLANPGDDHSSDGFPDRYLMDQYALKFRKPRRGEARRGGGCVGFTDLQGPSWSQRQNLIAFAGDCRGDNGIWLWSPESGDLRRIDTGQLRPDSPSWSNDGTRISFAAEVDESRRDLFVVEVASGVITRLTRQGVHGGGTSWSPDDEWIGYYRSVNGRWSIYRMRPDGTEAVQLNTGATEEDHFNVTWSPDGSSFAYSRAMAIHLQPVGGGAPTRVTPEGMQAVMPKWSPDGRRLTFDGNAGDGWELFVINADGTGLERLTHNDSVDANTTWSPDGRAIAYECRLGERRTICRLELESGTTERLF